jgi:N utilization substance protein A
MAPGESERLMQLFAQEVPEIAAGIVEVLAVARNAGVRSKVAVRSRVPHVDAISVCVGIGASRIQRIIDQLNGERVELVRWDASPERLIANALQPARIDKVILDLPQHRAMVMVPKDDVSLAIGRGGENRELASRLCGWEIDVVAT